LSSRIQSDLKDLCSLALDKGATRAKTVGAKRVVVDERVRLKCRYPPCESYGKSLMCPPYTPTPEEFRRILSKYKHAILIQTDFDLPEAMKKRLQSEGAKYVDLINEREFGDAQKKWGLDTWMKLNSLVEDVERAAFAKGYYYATGFVAGTCKLCDTCDVTSPCKHPWRTRPSMEAVGIDVFKTARNAGMGIEWKAGAERERVVRNCLVLVD
jgi:predicted metal-binding protein